MGSSLSQYGGPPIIVAGNDRSACRKAGRDGAALGQIGAAAKDVDHGFSIIGERMAKVRRPGGSRANRLGSILARRMANTQKTGSIQARIGVPVAILVTPCRAVAQSGVKTGQPLPGPWFPVA
jgi:hypothetical protein